MEEILTAKGKILLVNDQSKVFSDGTAILELAYSSDASILALASENLPPAFFELKSGLAGDVLQKISNYQLKLIILGQFNSLPPGSLRDFILESNKTGRVVFSDTLEKAVSLLK